MIAPMVLGYAMGAFGVYALLYRLAPVKAEELAAQTSGAEVITLFEDDGNLRRAA